MILPCPLKKNLHILKIYKFTKVSSINDKYGFQSELNKSNLN